MRRGAPFRSYRDILLVAFGALLYTLAASPFDWFICGWIALVPLLLAIRDVRPLQAFAYGCLYGVLICAGVAYWLFTAIAGFFVAQIPLALLLTVAAYLFFVGVYIGAFAFGASLLMQCRSPALRCTAVPALWVVAEFARSSLFSGFSWGLLGYSQHDLLGLVQIADATGIYGISSMLAAAAYAASELLSAIRTSTRKPWREMAFAAALVVFAILYGHFRLGEFEPPSSDQITIALVERQVPVEQRRSRMGYVSTFLEYKKSTSDTVSKNAVDLVVWPEFATGFYLDRDPLMRVQLSMLTEQTNAPLLLGGPRYESSGGQGRYYNSAYLIAPDGHIIDTYDKIRLLPFAEFRPFDLPDPGNRDRDALPTEFSPGSRETIFSILRAKFGVMICYEATYPEFARRLTALGADFIVNISNDIWLSTAGGRAAAAQHFAMATFRAIENRRAIARVTTAGFTGFIAPCGRSYDVSDGADVGVVDAISLEKRRSVYTRFGDWFAFACVIYTMVAIAWVLVLKYRADSDGIESIPQR